jgi:hypothetical protein
VPQDPVHATTGYVSLHAEQTQWADKDEERAQTIGESEVYNVRERWFLFIGRCPGGPGSKRAGIIKIIILTAFLPTTQSHRHVPSGPSSPSSPWGLAARETPLAAA